MLIRYPVGDYIVLIADTPERFQQTVMEWYEGLKRTLFICEWMEDLEVAGILLHGKMELKSWEIKMEDNYRKENNNEERSNWRKWRERGYPDARKGTKDSKKNRVGAKSDW